MQRAARHRQRSFVQCFRQGGMGLHGAGDIFRRAAELHHRHRLADQLGRQRTDDVHFLYAVALGIAQYLHEPRGVAHRMRAAVAHEGKYAGAEVAIGIAQLLGGLAHPGDLGPGINHPRYRFVIDVAGLAGDVLGDHHAFVGGLVRQHRPAHHVADGVDVGEIGAAVFVYHDVPTRVEREADAVGVEACGVGHAAGGHQHAVDLEITFALAVVHVQRHRFFRDRHLVHFGVEANIQSLRDELALRLFRDIFVDLRKQTRAAIEYGDLAAEPPPHAAEFEADHAAADHRQPLRHFAERKGTGGVDDAVTVERRLWERRRHRAGGDDEVLGLHGRGRAVVAPHFHPLLAGEAAAAVQPSDLVFEEQRLDAAGESAHHLYLARLHHADVELYRPGGDTVRRNTMLQVVIVMGGIEQCLGWNAADVEAGAAERGLAVLVAPVVDAGRAQPELRAAYRRHVTAGAAADHHYVVIIHASSSSKSATENPERKSMEKYSC